MRRIALIAAAVMIAVVGVTAGIRMSGRDRRGRGGGARSVQVVEAPIEETIEAVGVVQPLNRVEIKPPIGGRVEKLLVDEGAKVEAGQVLAWLSSSDRAAILDAARAKGPAEYKRWEDAYRPTPITAPLGGVVILRNAVVGETVDQGTVLFAISDTLIVLAQVDESSIGKIRKGMVARVTLDAYPESPQEGMTSDILYEGKSVSNVIQYGVKVRLPKVPDFFRSQMTATVRFIAGRRENALVIPSAAVTATADGTLQVMVPGPDGKPAPREVKTGIESGDRVEVKSGLEAGERVIIRTSRYVPQKAPETSPLGLPGGRTGQAGQGAGRPSTGGGERR